MRSLGVALVGGAIVMSCLLLVPVAVAEDIETKKACDSRGCYVISKRQAKPPPESRRADRSNSPRQRANPQDAENQKVREAGKKFTAAFDDYGRQFEAYTRCTQRVRLGLSNAGCGNAPTPPTPPRFGSVSFSGRGNQPIRISAGQAAAIAVARLQLPTIAPGIGPSPNLNPWDMAAVGYPLWLWADGPTHAGPISDSVAGLSVSLDAEVSSLTFRMGDGHTVTCAGTGHAWTAAVQPGAKSPDCGYSYNKPSLPDRAYTVAAIANWAVTWTSNGQSGVINVPVVNTTQLPVGELQVLVR
jgi:hypothetical protein